MPSSRRSRKRPLCQGPSETRGGASSRRDPPARGATRTHRRRGGAGAGGDTGPISSACLTIGRPVLRIRSLVPDKVTSLIVAAALAGVVPRLLFAVRAHIEYDGWWHVFIAQQDVLSNFLWEYHANAHPPLYFLLLKAATLIGKTRLTYRLVSLVAGLATAYVLGRIVSRWGGHWAVPGITTLAFSLSWSSIVISGEVRSYALCVLFLVLGGYAFFELSRPRLLTVARHSLLLSVASALALLSHYSAVLFLSSVAVVLAGRLALVRSFRLRVVAVLRRMPLRVLAPVVIPLATGAFLYVTHARPHTTAMNHLPEFYLVSSSADEPLRFLLRNTALQVGLFLPFRLVVASLWVEAAIGGASLVVVLAALALPRARGFREPLRAAGALFGVMVLVAMALGLAGAYPYGGALRHQFYLFPFLLVFLAGGLDGLLSRIGSRSARAGLLLLVVVVLTGGFGAGARQLQSFRDELSTMPVREMWKEFPAPSAVYVDQFSLVPFFSAYHDWTWRFTRACPTNSWIQQYTLTRGRQALTVFRDRSRWEVDLRAEGVGRDLRSCLELVAPKPVVVFALRQFPERDEKDGPASSDGLARAGASLAKAGIRTGTTMAAPAAVFVELRLDPEREPSPAQVAGATPRIATARVNPPAGGTFTCWIKGSGFQRGDEVLVNGDAVIGTTFGDSGLITFAGGFDLLQGRMSLSLVVLRPGTEARSNTFGATIPRQAHGGGQDASRGRFTPDLSSPARRPEDGWRDDVSRLGYRRWAEVDPARDACDHQEHFDSRSLP